MAPGALTKRKPDDGAAMVEFGLVMLPLMGVLLGVVTAGLAYFTGLQLDTAAQEGARVMYIGGSNAQAREAVIDATNFSPALAAGDVVITGTCTPAATPPATVTVTALRTVEVNWLFGTTDIDLEGRGVTRCQ
jgi:Flp pilus assembly protein TadG